MIDRDYVRLMARYNRWMNGKLYAAAASLTEEQRQLDKGAFFKSLHGTLVHLVWADDIWLARFEASAQRYSDKPGDFAALSERRLVLDNAILTWATSVSNNWLQEELRWDSGIYQQTLSRPAWIPVSHFFNHQTHHRGQATTLLMQFGVDPGVTDLVFMDMTEIQ
ncbi:DinB family protein [Methylovorus mays]|uniref:DinB family protein n=1 Tax=Methylovorus mays TaxID=184077 RepID=UPI001E4B6FA0|nr:DinB family protein [Methylovorus mays]MCB5206148.1 damage-inducible protein DinB [Methylovorus mays]